MLTVTLYPHYIKLFIRVKFKLSQAHKRANFILNTNK